MSAFAKLKLTDEGWARVYTILLESDMAEHVTRSLEANDIHGVIHELYRAIRSWESLFCPGVGKPRANDGRFQDEDFLLMGLAEGQLAENRIATRGSAFGELPFLTVPRPQ